MVCADANPLAIGRHFVKEFRVLPRASDQTYSQSLLDVVQELSVTAVLPLSSFEALPTAELRAQLQEAGAVPLTPSPRDIGVCTDKAATYRGCLDLGDVAPVHAIVSTRREFDRALEALGFPKRELCIKPTIGTGSKGFWRLSGDEQVDADLIVGRQRTEVSAELVRGLIDSAGAQFVISEFLPGIEYSVDVLAQNGVVDCCIPRERVTTNAGISTEGVVVENPAVQDLTRRVVETLALDGCFGLQAKLNDEGAPRLLEINPRIQGSVGAARMAGVNLPLRVLDHYRNVETDTIGRPVWGTRYFRFWKEESPGAFHVN